ncbi:MAG: hypothetical protein GXP59_00265 [Deltaproteobacteria bacterium]|nr:hypothetical protein [Deltaproteobacteria bacterium]
MCKQHHLKIIFLSLLALALAGCGSSAGNSGGQTADQVKTTANVSFTKDSSAVVIGANKTPMAGAASNTTVIGVNTCLACHSNPTLVPADKVINATGYLASKHVVHSTAIDQQTAQIKGCKVCHDPIGDGPTLESQLNASQIPAGGLAAVTCEDCHGAGGDHYGVGAIPTPKPDYTVCGQCHNALPSIPGSHPAGLNIISNYLAGKHYNGGTVYKSGVCIRCHSEEGYLTYIDATRDLDGQGLIAAMTGKSISSDAPLQCRSCHDPHTSKLRPAATVVSHDSYGKAITDTNGTPVSVQVFSSQFNLCTSCHQAFLNYTYDNVSKKFSYTLNGAKVPYTHSVLAAPGYPLVSNPNANWDTHYKYVDPTDGTTVKIIGYGLNPAAENSCTKCHDPHATIVSIK